MCFNLFSSGFTTASQVLFPGVRFYYRKSGFTTGSQVLQPQVRFYSRESGFTTGSLFFTTGSQSGFISGSQVLLPEVRVYYRKSGFTTGSQIFLPEVRTMMDYATPEKKTSSITKEIQMYMNTFRHITFEKGRIALVKHQEMLH